MVILLPCLNIVQQHVHIPVVVLRKQWLPVHEIPLHLGVLNVKDLLVKLLDILVAHLLLIESQKVS